MAIKPGDKLPPATLQLGTPQGPKNTTTDELFKGKKVVLFAVPGAFTPTCSAKHLPGFIDKADQLRRKGAQDIICLSVNDGFVMQAWGVDRGAGEKVRMVGDGSGSFTRALGLDFDASSFGMGVRSQRYAMIVEDGVVKQLFVEKPMEFKVSSAESVLEHL
jgi:peroxiredoxin